MDIIEGSVKSSSDSSPCKKSSDRLNFLRKMASLGLYLMLLATVLLPLAANLLLWFDLRIIGFWLWALGLGLFGFGGVLIAFSIFFQSQKLTYEDFTSRMNVLDENDLEDER